MWWEDKGLSDQTSVLPALELLHRAGTIDEFVHRHVMGRTEFDNYCEWRLGDRRVRNYGTLYLAFHGTRRGLAVGDDEMSLDVLAELIGRMPGGVVHLGSCSVLRADVESARRFLKRTGAQVVSGYERDIDWHDSVALDTAWLGYVARCERVGDAIRFFRKRFGSTIEHLKWEAVRGAS